MIQWNEIDYEIQVKVMDLFEELFLNQKDTKIQDGIAAAITELEIWSNSPCTIIEAEADEHFVANAEEQYPETD